MLKIDVTDLKPSAEDAELITYRLSYHVEGNYCSHPVSEGENSIGSSPLCDISIQAPGVYGQHACLKRNGRKLFIRNTGKGGVQLHGREIEDATLLAVGESFTIGSISAVVECVLPGDQQAAVKIDQTGIASLLGNQNGSILDLTARHLNRLNEFLGLLMRENKPTAGEALSDLLQSCFSPTSAVLLRRKSNDDWTALMELGAEGIHLLEKAANPDSHNMFRCHLSETEYRLLIRFQDKEEQPWRNEFCRLLLHITALSREGRLNPASCYDPVSKRKGQAPDSASGVCPANKTSFPWMQMAGNMIRSHLSRQTELCRNSDYVLIIGETGTGKELTARALHELWQRRGIFVAINCAAIPAELLDSELFGVAAGAATGVAARSGRFAQAGGGTLFLDEISEMPLPLQGKLLRVLQEKEYYPVGAKKLEKTDAKVIASSNLKETLLRSNHMRQDLYFRLSQAIVFLPPLRERRQDLADLSEHILNCLERHFHRNVTGLSIAALEYLKAYDWPGNVRELQNVLRNLYINVPYGSLIRSGHLPEQFHTMNKTLPDGTLAGAVKEVERKMIKREIDRQNSVRDAAKALGLSEGYLYRKIKKLGIQKNG